MNGEDCKNADPDGGIGNDQCYNFKYVKSKMSFGIQVAIMSIQLNVQAWSQERGLS